MPHYYIMYIFINFAPKLCMQTFTLYFFFHWFALVFSLQPWSIFWDTREITVQHDTSFPNLWCNVDHGCRIVLMAINIEGRDEMVCDVLMCRIACKFSKYFIFDRIICHFQITSYGKELYYVFVNFF